MGYFLWLNESINTTNVAKAIAIINDSNTVIGTTPGPQDVGHADVAAGCGELSLPSFSEPTTLESPLLITFSLYHTYVLGKPISHGR